MKRTIALILIALACNARANIIELGQIDLTGTFTLNHLYDFNNQGAAPFGWFGTITAQNVTGIFLPYVTPGDNLSMNSTALNTVQPFPLWTLGGYTFASTLVLITGADSGRYCLGTVDLSGNGFNPNDYPPFGAYSYWDFTAPPYDISHFDHDITGPINLSIIVAYDNGHVPDGGNTLLFFGLGAVCVLLFAPMLKNKVKPDAYA
jgi:hypothetical protein